MTKVFVLSFFGVSLILSIISAFTKYYYKGKSIGELSILEIKVLNNEATFLERMKLFFLNLFSSIYSIPNYIIAAVITGIVFLILR